jgi:hypothetical protein
MALRASNRVEKNPMRAVAVFPGTREVRLIEVRSAVSHHDPLVGRARGIKNVLAFA